MSTAVLRSALPPLIRPAAAAPVFLPKEHGSWSLALEPLALGLLVAPSWAGGALAGAVLAGFFARRPFKAAGSPIHSARRLAAREALVMWSALVVAGLFEVVVQVPWTALWPLLPFAGLGLLFLHFDAAGDSRVAAAEIAGSAAFACVPAAMATLAGLPVPVALVLAGLALARSVPAVLTVRSYLRSAKGGAPGRAASILAAGVASIGLLALRPAGVPWAAVLAGCLFFLRTLWLTGAWHPDWPARRVGTAEAILGLLYVGLIGWAYRG